MRNGKNFIQKDFALSMLSSNVDFKLIINYTTVFFFLKEHNSKILN